MTQIEEIRLASTNQDRHCTAYRGYRPAATTTTILLYYTPATAAADDDDDVAAFSVLLLASFKVC